MVESLERVDGLRRRLVDIDQSLVGAPDTVAPVRVAVSTISFAAVSIAVWSYDFRRIRILFWASVATG